MSTSNTDFSAVTKPAKPIRRPGWKFATARWEHWFGLGFGSGLSFIMPGTFGTLMGWCLFIVLDPWLDAWGWSILISLSYWLGIRICETTGKNLGVIDHGGIVWDEIVAIWIVLWVAGEVFKTPMQQLLCVVVFRFYDMVKPPPIRWFDRRFKSGFGVMLDDVVAAFFTLLTLALITRYWGVQWL